MGQIRTSRLFAYLIRGFSDSPEEFERLMVSVESKGESKEQAASHADFYRAVNPKNIPLTPLTSLLELKQAAERQCQSTSFAASQKAFDTWWRNVEPQYAEFTFTQTTTASDAGYLVEWTVLSSAAPGSLCGGSPLRARLDVPKSGQVHKLTIVPLSKQR